MRIIFLDKLPESKIKGEYEETVIEFLRSSKPFAKVEGSGKKWSTLEAGFRTVAGKVEYAGRFRVRIIDREVYLERL